MHVATRLYDSIVERGRQLLGSELAYDDAGLERDRLLVRLTALLHDIGHTPFSHAAEELFPLREGGQARYTHEDYSASIIRTHLREAIEGHRLNENYRLKADDVANLLEGNARAGRALFWRELISGQMDADRIDYLLRDSLHTGVDYGRFDWRRLVNSVEVIPGVDYAEPRLGVSEGGFHAAEGLVLARYFMFTQVYFHKTRVAFDHHLQRALSELLPAGHFPSPIASATREEGDLAEFLGWDDWRVLGQLAAGVGGEHGRRLSGRDHYREVYHTAESPSTGEIDRLARIREKLGSLLLAEEVADKSWYKVGNPDIPIVSDNPRRTVQPLSSYSSVVKGLASIGKVMLYSRREDVEEARRLVAEV
jgi:HD superfamily phosphohydrolase